MRWNYVSTPKLQGCSHRRFGGISQHCWLWINYLSTISNCLSDVVCLTLITSNTWNRRCNYNIYLCHVVCYFHSVVAFPRELDFDYLTHWGKVKHICVSWINIIGSDDGSSPRRRQAIIWTNDGILLIRPLGTKCSEILIDISAFPFKHSKISSAK